MRLPASRGVPCTDVLDRDLYRSVYLRDPDGHIVELAAGTGVYWGADVAPAAAGTPAAAAPAIRRPRAARADGAEGGCRALRPSGRAAGAPWR